MSKAVSQFLQIIRETWRTTLFCEHCGRETNQFGMANRREEIYTCSVCHYQKVYTVR